MKRRSRAFRSVCVATAFPLLWRAHFVSSLSIQAVCHFVSPLPLSFSDLSSFLLPPRYPNFLSMPFFTIITLRPVFISFIFPQLSRLFLKFLLTEFLLRSIPQQIYCKPWIHTLQARPLQIQHFIQTLASYNWNRIIKATTAYLQLHCIGSSRILIQRCLLSDEKSTLDFRS
jgi:hypothetical protein